MGASDRGKVAQQQEAALVGPLEVVEHEHDRLVLTHRRKEAHDGGEQEEPLGVCVGSPGRRQVGDAARQGRKDSGQLGPVSGHVGEELILRGVGDVVPERLGEELVGSGQLLLAVAEEDHRPSLVCDPGCLGYEGGLAESGLTGDEHHFTSSAARHPLVGIGYRLGFSDTTDHTHIRSNCQMARERDSTDVDGAVQGLPQNPHCLDRVRKSL